MLVMGGLGATEYIDFGPDEGSTIVGKPVAKKAVANTKAGAEPLPRASTPGSGFLDLILPVRVGLDGKSTIYGLPPAIAYAVAASLAAGGVYYTWKRFGRPLVLSNPSTKKRRNGRRGRTKSRARRTPR